MSSPETNAVSIASGVRQVAVKLLEYCRANDWTGYDPYDALNSKLIEAFPFLNSRLSRLVLTQALKRSPINLRRLLRVPKTQNPKAIALFLASFVTLSRHAMADVEDLSELMIERLSSLRAQGVPYSCWGYSFPWQTRNLLVPAWAPNLICTAFVAGALLDVHEHRQDSRCLDMAVSGAEYILNELFWHNGTSVASFSYPLPSLQNPVHNANFLAAALLCRVFRHTGEKRFLDAALRAARYSVTKQRADGSWPYGEASSQQWIDNFHTGYNLCALRALCRHIGTAEFDSSIRRGFEFYRSHFFREDGAARYFDNRTYPIDIHSVAQSIITLLAFRDLDPGNSQLARWVFRWAMRHMWNDQGFFYYRVLRIGTIRTSYMRWSQAWMLHALSELLCESESVTKYSPTHDSKAFVKVC